MAYLAGIFAFHASACQHGACAVIWRMKFVFLLGILCGWDFTLFLESFHLFVFLDTVQSILSLGCSSSSSNLLLQWQELTCYLVMGEKGRKAVARDLPGGGGVIVNSVLVFTTEKWAGRIGESFDRVVKSALRQVKVHSMAITGTSGIAVKDWQFGYDCELTIGEWSLFCRCFFRDPSITKDEAGVRTALQMVFLHLRSWYSGDGTTDECPRA